MYLSYLDESGDDGVFDPNQKHGSSQFMVYSNVFFEADKFRQIHKQILEIRRRIKTKFKVSFIQTEMHTRDFLLGKGVNLKQQKKLKFTDFRKQILFEYAREIAQIQGIKVFSTVIDKVKHKKLKTPQEISEKLILCSLTKMNYSISTGFNQYPDFMLISDEGRQTSTRKIVRKIQVYAPVYSKSGQKDMSIKNIVEDCLFKNSKDSYFLQLADFMAYFCMLCITKDSWDKKLEKHISLQEIEQIFDILKPVLNQKCSNDVVCGPKGINFT